MANAMNLVNITVVGRLLANPTVAKHNNNDVTNFRMRVNQTIAGNDAHVDFEISCWNGLANVSKVLKKGRLVAVTSNSLTQTIWNAPDGSGKQLINNKIMASSVTVMDSAPLTAGQQMPNTPQNAPQFADEEIPF